LLNQFTGLAGGPNGSVGAVGAFSSHTTFPLFTANDREPDVPNV
jgi:hypothetical protein